MMGSTGNVPGISGRRVWLVHALLASILSGSLYAIIADREYWPFSPYPMYSWVERDRSVTRLQLFGMTREGPSGEMPLTALRYLRPFDEPRLFTALERIRTRPDGEQALRKALGDLLTRYETLRRSGRHTGPPLQGIRLYVLTWREIDPRAFTAEQPDHRELLAEVIQPVAEGP